MIPRRSSRWYILHTTNGRPTKSYQKYTLMKKNNGGKIQIHGNDDELNFSMNWIFYEMGEN